MLSRQHAGDANTKMGSNLFPGRVGVHSPVNSAMLYCSRIAPVLAAVHISAYVLDFCACRESTILSRQCLFFHSS